ncbi:uncharacterized protein LOC105182410 [Harpegnathos saltator]|uniref:uncharacterized protein LOC105182410 n=1 Tax=Harpegnathos saltator TaxID=610380 RepID=UPI000DBEEA15|nr:uncharacterized protein LOC105182410 [Harpegnathos saltator]
MARDEADRGWAWAIVIGVTVINLSVLPVQQCFGLIFAERFASLDITATQTSLILHLNGTITCSLGLISGPMMKRFAFRKVAYFGSLTVVLGICAAAFAMSLPTLIVTYCIIIGVGQGIIFPATSLAMNTYFRRKRNIAMGFSVTMTGLGPILMPLLIDILLENYATTGTLLILAGIATHSVVGASLLKPFEEIEKQVISTNKAAEVSEKLNGARIEATSDDNETQPLKSSVQCRLINEDSVPEERRQSGCPLENGKAEERSALRIEPKESASVLRKIARNLDLDLLRDNRYLAIVLGMGISLVAEANFNAMIPFVLAELASLDRTSIATVMSIQAAADIAGRLCVPLLAQKAGWTCRNLYMVSLLGSTLGRTILSTWGTSYIVVIAVSLIVGLAKGTKAVFQALIIPDYVPLERLPSASGIQMVCNGILSISVGPIIGVVHDVRNSYVGALYFTSLLSMSCVFLWLIMSSVLTPEMSTKVPPNGGWGWIIVMAYVLNSLSTIPVIQTFGLVFKDSFTKLNLTATNTAVIINVNFAFGMIFGLFNGPLLKTYGYRKVSVIGSVLFTLGLILTTFANNLTFIIISYGLLTSVGLGMSMSGFSLAVNTYFTTRRTRAMGLAVTVTGLGPIIMPQVTSFLLSFYGIQGTILLLGGYSLHSLVGAALLHPLKWHMKTVPLCLESVAKAPDIFNNAEKDTSSVIAEDETALQSSRPTANNYQRKRKMSTIDHDSEVGSIYGFDTPLPRQTSVEARINASYEANYDIEMSILNGTSTTNLQDSRKYLRHPWSNSTKSINSVNLGSSMKIFEESVPITKKLTFIDGNEANGNCQNVEKESLVEKKAVNSSTVVNGDDDDDDNEENESIVRRFLRWLAAMYDLDLLRDSTYVNMMLGMSVAIFAEANFSLLTPFILADMNMTTAEIASAMSLIATSDLISRGAAPFLGEWLRQSARMMYLLSLCLLIISRTLLLFANSITSVMIVAVGLGIAKGIRSVYMVLVIPSYVPIEKLPSASAIQMLTNGIILTCVGPVIGLIRDSVGSYTPCIILINSVTGVTVIMWLTEMVIRMRRTRWTAKSSDSMTS